MAFDENRDGSGNRLLTGWKQIAFYFGKDESTAKRWAAQRGLPVHRVPGQKRASVYAYSAELEAWLRRQGDIRSEAASAPDPQVVSAVPPALPERPPRAGLVRIGAATLAVVLLLGLAGIAVLGWRGDGAPPLGTHRPAASAESLYLDGMFHLEQRTGDGLDRAIGLFTAAVADDPDYALAYVGLADAYNLISQYTTMPAAEAYPQAKAAAERAIALDPDAAAAHAALAFNTFYWQRDFPAALSLFQRAVTLDPSNARVHHWYALAAMHDRHFDLAEREIREAQRLDPRSPAILANKGLILFHAGQTDAALAILRPLAAAEPQLLSPHAYLATIYLAAGRPQDFLREYRAAADLAASVPQLAIAAAAQSGFEHGGEVAMLSAMFTEQQHQYAADREPAFKLAVTAAMLGDTAQALGYLNASLARNEPDILGIRLEPALLSLHDDTVYRTVVAEVGFDND